MNTQVHQPRREEKGREFTSCIYFNLLGVEKENTINVCVSCIGVRRNDAQT